MGFKKGEPRPANAGRKKDSVNKVTAVTRELLTNLSAETYPEFIERMKNLDDRDFCAFWLKMQEYVLPKLASQEVKVTENNSQATSILRELAKKEYEKDK